MTDPSNTTDQGPPIVSRRWFIAAAGGLSASLLAGCTTETTTNQRLSTDNTGATDSQPATPPGGSSGDTSNAGTTEATQGQNQPEGSARQVTTAGATGRFSLLITDLPADIGDFKTLNVTFAEARVFGGRDPDPGEDPEDNNENEVADTNTNDAGDHQPADNDGDDSEHNNGTNGDPGVPENDSLNGETIDDAGNGVARRRGFYILDLDGATVDLTDVVGEKAVPIVEEDLSAGEYTKIELYVDNIEGTLNGNSVKPEVRVPSNKLQVTRPFEIREAEAVEFVFDINVVRRGQDHRYNLRPVISGSGINGTHVDIKTIDENQQGEEEDGETQTSVDDDTDGNGNQTDQTEE